MHTATEQRLSATLLDEQNSRYFEWQDCKKTTIRRALITIGVVGTLLLVYKAYSCHGPVITLEDSRSEKDVGRWFRSAGPSMVLLTETAHASDLLHLQRLG
eukprot:gene23010-30201_t